MKTVNPMIAIYVAAALATFTIRASAEVDPPSGSACETQALPVMPRSAIQGSRHDEVKVQALIHDGVVRQVEVIKGPRAYAGAIRTAMEKYRCRIQASDFWVTQVFEFRTLDD